jgi:predicted AAA+ superfamily ATPase
MAADNRQMSYAPRIADSELANRLEAAGAVLIEGAKACGKTETARQLARSEVLLDVDEEARAAAELNPALILEGETPRLIDEWQVEPRIWNHVRRAVDERKDTGQFILAGSAQPTDDDTRHTGAGRISRLRMRPMSLHESGAGSGEISLAALMEGRRGQVADPGLGLEQLANEIARGGWPGFRALTLPQALRRVRDYLDEILRADLKRMGLHHRPEKVARLVRSLARNIATPVAATTLAADASEPGDPIASATVAEYLSALGRLFIIEDQPAWQPHLRSRYRLRKAAKRHFVDPSLAVAALRTEPGALMRDLNFLGLLFESMVVRDLRIYGQAIDGEVEHYQDNNDLEVDAIVRAGDSWGAFEVKLGGERRVEEGAAALLKFADRIDTTRSGEPAVLAVVVGTGYGYVREDGVQVIPIGALGP